MLHEYLYLFLLVGSSLQTPLAASDTSPLNEVSTNTSPPPTTTSPSSTLKSGIPDCGIRGTATHALLAQVLDSTYASTVLACQLDCETHSRCESWSWYPPTTTSSTAQEANCVYYTTYITDAHKYINVNSQSETVFSDKYPEDGSNYCFGDPAWGISGVTMSVGGVSGTATDGLSAPTGGL